MPIEEEWQELLQVCIGRIGLLSANERNFIDTLRRTTRWAPPSEKQARWLAAIAERLKETAA